MITKDKVQKEYEIAQLVLYIGEQTTRETELLNRGENPNSDRMLTIKALKDEANRKIDILRGWYIK